MLGLHVTCYIVAWQTYRQTEYNTSLPLAGKVNINFNNFKSKTIIKIFQVGLRFSITLVILFLQFDHFTSLHFTSSRRSQLLSLALFVDTYIAQAGKASKYEIRTVSSRVGRRLLVVIVALSGRDVIGRRWVSAGPGGDPAGRLNGNVAYGLMLPSSSDNTRTHMTTSYMSCHIIIIIIIIDESVLN